MGDARDRESGGEVIEKGIGIGIRGVEVHDGRGGGTESLKRRS